MKQTILFTIAFSVFSGSLFAQGSLTPPGPPAPMMKTLSQVEPRIPISSSTNIAASGSYYLATNIVGAIFAIDINANNVTLDLNGFSIIGNDGTVGIFVNGPRTNIVIRNGSVRGFVNSAVLAYESDNCQFDRLTFSHNGRALSGGTNALITACSVSDGSINGISAERSSTVIGCSVRRSGGIGIYVGDGSTVKDCNVFENTYGIAAGVACSIRNCTLITNLSDGITCEKGSSVSECTVQRTNGRGIVLGEGCTAAGCTVYYSHDVGIRAARACTIMNCTVDYGDDDGILVDERCLVTGNSCSRNGLGSAAGIRIVGVRNKIDGNSISGNFSWGILTTNVSNLIIRNTVSQHTVNYSIVAGNTLGEILNFGGPSYTITNANPWANIQY